MISDEDTALLEADVSFGITVTNKLGDIEKSVAMHLAGKSFNPSGNTGELSTAKMAEALKLKEERVLGAIRVLQAKGLLRVVFHPQMTALADLGAGYRQSLARLHDGKEA